MPWDLRLNTTGAPDEGPYITGIPDDVGLFFVSAMADALEANARQYLGLNLTLAHVWPESGVLSIEVRRREPGVTP